MITQSRNPTKQTIIARQPSSPWTEVDLDVPTMASHQSPMAHRGLPLRERPGGVENSGGWKTYRKFGEKPLPKNVFGPPTYDTFSPPLSWRLSVISLKRKRHRPDQPQFLRPSKVVLESTLCSTFPPPPQFTRYVLPPLSRCPSLVQSRVGSNCGADDGFHHLGR